MNGSASLGGSSASAATGAHNSANSTTERMRRAYLVTDLGVAMKRMLKRGNRFRAMVALVVTLFQLPAVLWLCMRTHTLWPMVAAFALSFPYLSQLPTPWSHDGRRLTMYLALAWWASCITFTML